jgi:flagellar L-ring protein precursor FlgH
MMRLLGSERVGLCALVVGVWCGVCAGQVLFEAANASAPAPSQAATQGDGGGAAPVVSVQAPPSLESVSLLAVEPPEPPSYAPNDLITIIISERSKAEREHTFEGEKRYGVEGGVDSWVDMLKLLELRLESTDRSGGSEPIAELMAEFRKRYEADASYERDDTVTARVTARVVEVKPNNTLLLEARTVVATDTEEQTIVLSGICRVEDITIANSIMSNQMFDLRLDIQNVGDVRNDGQKGMIPKVIDAIFNF